MTGSHNLLVAHTCSLCHEVFDSVKEKDKHDRIAHKRTTRSESAKVQTCKYKPSCDYYSQRPFDVKRHEQTCRFNPLNMYSCRSCTKAKTYSDQANLISHYVQFHHARSGNHLCLNCHVITVTREAMDMHQKHCKPK